MPKIIKNGIEYGSASHAENVSYDNINSGIPANNVQDAIDRKVPFIIGTGSTAGTWLGTLSGLTAYYDGLLILYKPSVGYATDPADTTLNINNIGAKPVFHSGNLNSVTNKHSVGENMLLSYTTEINSSSYGNGAWEIVNAEALIANNIEYNNLTSGLTSTNVQGAIDELSGWQNFQYNTENAVGFTYVSGTEKTVFHQILLSDASSTTAWGAKMTNLPFVASNVIKASFLASSSSSNKYGPYYVSSSDMFRAAFENTNLMAQFGTSYPTLPARVIADVYYTK